MAGSRQVVGDNTPADGPWNYDARTVLVQTSLSPGDDVWDRLRHMPRLRTLIVYGSCDMTTLPVPVGTAIERIVVQPQEYIDVGVAMQLSRVPDTIVQLRYLRTLELRFCMTLRRLPDALTEVTSLRTLQLHCCRCFVELPADIGRLWQLETLDVSHCGALRTLPDSIGRLRRLRNLVLTGCKLDTVPDGISALSNVIISLPNRPANESVLHTTNARNRKLPARQLTLILASQRQRHVGFARLPRYLHRIVMREFLLYYDN